MWYIFTYEILFSHTVATVQLFECEIEGLYVEMNFTCEMIISSVELQQFINAKSYVEFS